jgi:hypothetical protein
VKIKVNINKLLLEQGDAEDIQTKDLNFRFGGKGPLPDPETSYTSAEKALASQAQRLKLTDKDRAKEFTARGKAALRDVMKSSNIDEGMFQTFYRALKTIIKKNAFEDKIKVPSSEAWEYALRVGKKKAKESGETWDGTADLDALQHMQKVAARNLATEVRMRLGNLAMGNEASFMTILIPGVGPGLAITDLLASIFYIGPYDELAEAVLKEFDGPDWQKFADAIIEIASRPEVTDFKSLTRFINRYDRSLLNPTRIRDMRGGGYMESTPALALMPNLDLIEKKLGGGGGGGAGWSGSVFRMPRDIDRAEEIIDIAIKNGELDQLFKDYMDRAVVHDTNRNLVDQLEYLEKNTDPINVHLGKIKDKAGELAKKVEGQLGPNVRRAEKVIPDELSQDQFDNLLKQLGGDGET